MNFWETLFEHGERTCFSRDPYGTKLSPVSLVSGQFFSINPMHTKREDKNVTSFRSLLFEIDSMADVEDQLAFIEQSRLPYSTAVFSGGKSVHFIISLSEPVESRSDYKALWQRVHRGLDGRPDRSTSNPSRFSRVPGAIRMGTTTEQRLLKLNERVSLTRLEDWLTEKGVGPIQLAERTQMELPSGMRGLLTGWTHKFIAEGAPVGEWNLNLFRSSCDAFRNNYSVEEWCEVLLRFHAELDESDMKTINSAWRIENG